MLLVQQACTHSVSAQAIKAGSKQEAGLQDVVVIHQRSQLFSKCELYLSDNAVRLVAQNGDLIIASAAPSWEIVLFSRKKNQGYTVSAAQSKISTLGLMSSSVSKNGRVRPPTEVLFGLKTTKIVCDESFSDKDPPIFQDRTIGRIVVANTLKIATPCKIKPQIQDYLNWMFSLNRFTGVPLELTTSYKDGSSQSILSTSSIEHTKKPASFFAYPTGFKKAAGEVQVMLTDGFSETLEDLWGSVPKKGK